MYPTRAGAGIQRGGRDKGSVVSVGLDACRHAVSHKHSNTLSLSDETHRICSSSFTTWGQSRADDPAALTDRRTQCWLSSDSASARPLVGRFGVWGVMRAGERLIHPAGHENGKEWFQFDL